MSSVEEAQSGSAVLVPLVADRVWQAFWEIDQCRRGNGYSADAINHSDLAAFQACAGRRFDPWERRAIFAMDRVRLAYINKAATPAEEDTPVLTAAGFDAMFG